MTILRSLWPIPFMLVTACGGVDPTDATASDQSEELGALEQPQSSPGCEVDYRVNILGGGFQAEVVITNQGDPSTAWEVSWTFENGERVQQAFSATISQRQGGEVTATNVAFNGAIATGGSVLFGFTASHTGVTDVPDPILCILER